MSIRFTRFSTRLAALLTCCLMAATGAVAAQGKSTRGLRCGKGHAKHSKAVGKSCAHRGKGRAKGHSKPSGTKQPRATEAPSSAQAPATLNPAQQCKAESAKDADAFAQKYGTNANKRNAFGKCVSAVAKSKGDQSAAAPTTTP